MNQNKNKYCSKCGNGNGKFNRVNFPSPPQSLKRRIKQQRKKNVLKTKEERNDKIKKWLRRFEKKDREHIWEFEGGTIY